MFKEWLLLQEEVSFPRNLEFFKKTMTDRGFVNNALGRDANYIDKLADKEDIILHTVVVNNTSEKRKNAFVDFLIGFAFNKPNALPEDFQMAWDTYDFFIKHRGSYFQTHPDDKNLSPALLGLHATKLNEFRKNNTKSTKPKTASQAETVYDQDITNDLKQTIHYTIYKIPALSEEDVNDKNKTNAQAALMCQLGKGTSWCTAHPGGTYYQNYLRDDIYVVYRNGKPQYQLNVKPRQSFNVRTTNDVDQFMDVNDNPVSGYGLLSSEGQGTYSRYLYRILSGKLNLDVFHPGEKYNKNNIIKKIVFEDYTPGTPEVDALIKNTNSIKNAYAYAKLVGNKVSPQIEDMLVQSPYDLLDYAKIIGKLPPAMEKSLARNTSTTHLLYYAQAIKGPLPPEIEKVFYEKLKDELPKYAKYPAQEYVKLTKKQLPPDVLTHLGIDAYELV